MKSTITYLNKNSRKILLFIILLLLILFYNYKTISDSYSSENKKILKNNYMSVKLSHILSNIEAKVIDDFDLKYSDKTILLTDILNTYDYHIIIYQNGIVCDHCIDFLISNWKQQVTHFPSNLNPNLLIMGDKFDRNTFLTLKKKKLADFYYIDFNHHFKRTVLLNDFPTNFIFLLDNKKQIIYADYFTNDNKEILLEFFNKIIRYTQNHF